MFFLLVAVGVIWQWRWANLVLFPRKRRKIPMKKKREHSTDSANRRVVPDGGRGEVCGGSEGDRWRRCWVDKTGVDELLLCYWFSVLVIRNLVKRNFEGNR